MSRASHSCDPDCPHLREDQLDFGQSLFQQIDLDAIVAHNEAVHGSCRLVFKPYAERLLADPHARSDSDPELMIHIPFISSVTLKSFVVVGGSAQTAPARVRLWINREDIDFSNADDIPPTQVFDLNFDPAASVEYMPKYASFLTFICECARHIFIFLQSHFQICHSVCRVSKFSNISHLVMMFPSNFGGDYTQISYIGLKGDVMGARRQAVIAVYESKPMGHTLKDPLAQKAGLGM